MPKNSRKEQGKRLEESKRCHNEYKQKMKIAVEKIATGELSIRAAANRYSLTKSALHRMWSKYKKMNNDEKTNCTFEKQQGFRQILNSEEENALGEYLIKAAQMCYGLTVKDTCELAYRFAIANEKTVPDSWHKNKTAGKEWIRLFRKKNI